ncbi:MAG: aspartate kinase, partial [Planctomycetes bacterium]|nr:aspartate kinase [Planctomycetota bacterium]
MIVAKFGGSTLSSYKSLRKLYDTLVAQYNPDELIIVCSAFKGITDSLLKIAYANNKAEAKDKLERILSIHKKVLHHLNIKPDCMRELFIRLRGEVDELSPDNIDTARLDSLLSYGERLSAKIISEVLNKFGIPSISLEPKDISFYTDSNYGNAVPLPESEDLIRERLKEVRGLPVITGYIGITKDGFTTTLGRNGSDYTASYIGSCISADEVHFWKDISSIFDAHPNYIKSPKRVPEITYTQLEILSFFGSKVIHPSTLLPLKNKKIVAKIFNFKNPEEAGTVIKDKISGNSNRFFLSIETDITKISMQTTFT